MNTMFAALEELDDYFYSNFFPPKDLEDDSWEENQVERQEFDWWR